MTSELAVVADNADLIVNGYAFKCENENVSVLNLNKPDRAARLTLSGEMIETSMDDIELAIVQDYLRRNRKFLEAYDA